MRNHFYAFATLTLMMKRLSTLPATPSFHSSVDDYNQLPVYRKFLTESLRVIYQMLAQFIFHIIFYFFSHVIFNDLGLHYEYLHDGIPFLE